MIITATSCVTASYEAKEKVVVGDNDQNYTMRGFISFDISSLPDLPLEDVKIGITNITKTGDPTNFGNLEIGVYRYGTMGSEDFYMPFNYPAQFPPAGLSNISLSDEAITDYLEERRTNGESAFQYKLGIRGACNYDDEDDYFVINPDNVKLYVSQ